MFRFDPPSSHAARFGTCYFATEPIGAFIETMLGMGDPTQSEVDERRITSCEVKGVLRLANLTSPLVLGYRVDASFSASSGGDYAHFAGSRRHALRCQLRWHLVRVAS